MILKTIFKESGNFAICPRVQSPAVRIAISVFSQCPQCAQSYEVLSEMQDTSSCMTIRHDFAPIPRHRFLSRKIAISRLALHLDALEANRSGC
jgi:hypothetical protein